MVSAVTKLQIPEPNRGEAKKGAILLERATTRDRVDLSLTRPSGEKASLELSPEIVEALRLVLDRMADSDEVLLLHEDAELTPEQAAKVLGISRPLVYQRMDDGRLPFREVGAHRRVSLNDVLKLKGFEERKRAAARELAEDTDDTEINDAPTSQGSS